MTIADRYDEYVAKAKEAEEQADKATDERTRHAWRKVAAGYRDLAIMAESERWGRTQST